MIFRDKPSVRVVYSKRAQKSYWHANEASCTVRGTQSKRFLPELTSQQVGSSAASNEVPAEEGQGKYGAKIWSMPLVLKRSCPNVAAAAPHLRMELW